MQTAIASRVDDTIDMGFLPPQQYAPPRYIPQQQPQTVIHVHHGQQAPHRRGVVTIQKTGKFWKGQILLSVLLILGGILAVAVGASGQGNGPSQAGI